MTSKDSTFTTFTPEQAAQYAVGRGGAYPSPIYQAIFEFHSGKRVIFLDVGTGPGKVVFDLIPLFQHGIGCDSGVQMIEQAKKDAARLGYDTAGRTSFAVAGGEDCDMAVPDSQLGQVDLVTVAMAAHWFHLPKFYASAARVLRPGGTLAIWTCSSYYCHPSTPHAEQVQEILFDLERNMLAPYATPGNMLSQGAYEDLDLPWDDTRTESLFDKASLKRRDWDRSGMPSLPKHADGSPGPFLFSEESTPERFGIGLDSASMVVRWRQTNPGKAHGKEDPVRLTVNRLQEVLGENGKFIAGPSCSLLLMRRK